LPDLQAKDIVTALFINFRVKICKDDNFQVRWAG